MKGDLTLKLNPRRAVLREKRVEIWGFEVGNKHNNLEGGESTRRGEEQGKSPKMREYLGGKKKIKIISGKGLFS